MKALPQLGWLGISMAVLTYGVVCSSCRKQSHADRLKVDIPPTSLVNTAPATNARRVISISADQKIYLDGVEMNLDHLADALKALREKSPESKLELQADEKVPFGILVKVWNTIKSVGYPPGDVPARIKRPAANGH